MRPPDLLGEVSFSHIVLDARGGILRISLSGDQKYRLPVEQDGIAPEAVRAVLHYEDRYFYSHPGVNPLSLARAALASFIGKGRRVGASTITMQVARLRYGLKTSTVRGKIKQIFLALLLERHYSKQQILEAYFNLAPYGGCVEGIEAAARIYFNKPASALTSLESHGLAIVAQNPGARNPANGQDFDRARQRLEAEFDPGVDASAPLKVRSISRLPFAAPHLAMELLGSPGQTVIRTGVEPDLQSLLERSLKSLANRGRRLGINNAAAILVDYETMLVTALAGSANFFDAEICGQVDGSRAKRSPGSTLKPFIYALALDQGLIHPMTMLADSPRSFGGYNPENFDHGFRGPVPAHEALKASRNLPAIALSEKLSGQGLYGLLRNAGIILPHGPEYYGLALALGGAEISMRNLAELYAMLANQGLWRPLRLTRAERHPAPARLLSPEAAWLALQMLENDNGERGKIPNRYKTGTSNGLRDAWTAGVIGKYALVVWVGNFDNQYNPHLVGAETALPLYLEISEALAGMRKLKDRQPEKLDALNLAKVKVCASTGDLYSGHCAETDETWIIPGVSPTADSGVLRPVVVDRATGMRACQPESGRTDEIWMEFWPSEMLKIFESAGISKPGPPEWLPECRAAKLETVARDPVIVLPRKKVVYQRRLSEPDFKIPLMASADVDAGDIHWYAGASYIGSSKPGEILMWSPRMESVEIQAVDGNGGTAKRKCLVQTLP